MQLLFKTRTQDKMKIEYIYVGYSLPMSGLGAATDETRVLTLLTRACLKAT
jgi:hypothetical protein